jgi:glycosyltransferase involved in cell wall biosynthesis
MRNRPHTSAAEEEPLRRRSTDGEARQSVLSHPDRSDKQRRLKRILLVMMQPPGSSGVQGLIYNKILPYLELEGWEFHFAGPDPSLTSVLTEKVECPGTHLHYTRNVSWSRRFSVMKNRQPKSSPSRLALGCLQLLSTWAEKLFRHDANAYLKAGIFQVVREADSRYAFDLIAGKSPDFRILDAVASLTAILGKPLVAMVVDPFGRRDGDLFSPYQPQRQREILSQCCGAMFMSPLTRQRYVDADLVSSDKAYVFTDSYPSSDSLYGSGCSVLAPVVNQGKAPDHRFQLRLAYLGMLPEWRPVETLLDAVERSDLPVYIDIFGFLYPEAESRIRSSTLLRSRIRANTAVSYSDSHAIAADCTAQLVVIGPRHLDNQPSKFFEYLGHRKPIFVIGPPGNPIEDIIHALGIGVYCDVGDSDSIAQGFDKLHNEYPLMVDAYERNREQVEQFSAPSVAAHWRYCLNRMLASTQQS